MFKLFLLQEPILSSGYICQFNDLEVRAVLLDEIMKVSKLKNNNSDSGTWMVPSRANVQKTGGESPFICSTNEE